MREAAAGPSAWPVSLVPTQPGGQMVHKQKVIVPAALGYLGPRQCGVSYGLEAEALLFLDKSRLS